jgi:hypothetical protein
MILLACKQGEPAPAPPAPPAPARAAPSAEPVSPPRAAPCDEAGIEAARTALAIAAEREVASHMLADCLPEAVVCPAERGAIERGESCRIAAIRHDARWDVRIMPRPMTGAPPEIEIWTDDAGREAGNVRISGSTWGVADGVTIEGRGERTSHTHGGDAARIGQASFVVDNRRDEPLELALVATRWLVAGSCELPRRELARPAPAGFADAQGRIANAMTTTIPARSSETVTIGHEVQPAYMAYCDRFATAAVFDLDGETLEVIAEHHVVRRTPLR